MRTAGNPSDVDTAYQAWVDAGRRGDAKSFMLGYMAHHKAMTSDAAAYAPRVELRICRMGTRRQAFWRVAGTESWDWIDIARADRAEREGRVSVGSLVDATVVMFVDPS